MGDDRSVAGGDRIVQLDRLRGIAILGILFMNIPFMGSSAAVILSHRVDLVGWTGADRVALFLQAVLAEGTARGMLEMLFGAGMVILTARLAATLSPGGVFRAYYRRYLVLFAFGLAHLFLFLWTGDILSIYAPAALLLFWFRKLGARAMLIVGLLIGPLFFTAGGFAQFSYTRSQAVLEASAGEAQRAGRPLSTEQREAVTAAAEERERIARLPATLEEDRAGRLADLPGYVRAMWGETLKFLGKGFHVFVVIEALATMLIGAALFKWGVLQGARSTRFYVGMMLLCYGIAVPLRVAAAMDLLALNPAFNPILIVSEWSRVAMVAGHVALIALVARTVAGARLLEPFARAGRIALSLYLFQTLAGMWLLFPGIGLGLWGSMGWAGLMLTAAALTAIQLVIATLYLRRYRTGPIEWLWRRASGAGPSSRAPDGAGPPPLPA